MANQWTKNNLNAKRPKICLPPLPIIVESVPGICEIRPIIFFFPVSGPLPSFEGWANNPLLPLNEPVNLEIFSTLGFTFAIAGFSNGPGWHEKEFEVQEYPEGENDCTAIYKWESGFVCEKPLTVFVL